MKPTLVSAPDICSVCNGSGWVPQGSGSMHVKACSCQEDLRKRQRFAGASIPKRYFPHCNFAGFHDRNNPELMRAKRRAVQFVDEWPLAGDDRRGLLFMGPCGVGKTHLAVAVLQELIDAGKPGKMLFSNFQELIQEIQGSFDAESPVRKSEIMSPLLEADLLVLDELGSQKPTTFVNDILYYIINSRYNDERVTIFTTNYFDEAPEREEKLADRIGNRLRSRLHEMTEPVIVRKAEDYRKSKGKNFI
jgi:DNA replication protein DnaC